MYFISIPGEPVAKQRPRHTSKGVTYTPDKTRNYERQVKYHARMVMGTTVLQGPLKLHILFRLSVPDSWPAWKREAALRHEIMPTGKPDLDNLVKSIKDGMNGIAYNDDAQVVELSVKKVYGDEPGVDVVIDPMLGRFPVTVTRNKQTGELQA